MHAMCLHERAYISDKVERIREIKVSLESEEHARPLCAQNLTQARKLACIHAMCLHAQAYISAKLGHIREFNHLWNEENLPDLSEHKI